MTGQTFKAWLDIKLVKTYRNLVD